MNYQSTTFGTKSIIKASGTCRENAYYHYNSISGKLITYGIGGMMNFRTNTQPWFSVMSSIVYLKVGYGFTSIGHFAFEGSINLKSISFPETLTYIGAYSFLGSHSLVSVVIPSSVGIIDEQGFNAEKSLSLVIFENNSPFIKKLAFSCSDKITTIIYTGSEAPTYTNTTNILCNSNPFCITYGTCGSSSSSHFIPTAEIKVIVSPNYSSDSFCQLTRISKYIASGKCGRRCKWILSKENELYIYGHGIIDDYENGKQPWYSYRSIIEEIIIVDGIIRIGNNAFRGMTLIKEMLLPEGVESIGEYAFFDCSQLKTLVLPNTIKSIEQYGISNCQSLTNVYHLSTTKIESINANVLNNCPNVNSIYVSTSYEGNFCSKTINIANGTCGNNTYYHLNEDNTSLIIYGNGFMEESYLISSTPHSSSPWINHYNTIEHVKIEYGVKSISDHSFYYCYNNGTIEGYEKINSIEIGNTVIRIGSHAFGRCTSLTSLVIGKRVTTIKFAAFIFCQMSKIIYYPPINPICQTQSDSYCNYNPFCACDTECSNKNTGYFIPNDKTTIYVPSENKNSVTNVCQLTHIIEDSSL